MHKFERFPTLAAMTARAIEIAATMHEHEVECGIYSDNNGLTHRPQVIIREGATVYFLRWYAFADESGIDLIGKRQRVEARELSERYVESIKAAIVAAETQISDESSRVWAAMEREAIESDQEIKMLSESVYYASEGARVNAAQAQIYMQMAVDAESLAIKQAHLCNAIGAQEQARLYAKWAIEDRLAAIARAADIRATPAGWSHA